MTTLQSSVPSCTACHLHRHAKTVCVPSKGSQSPLIYFVGEGPGKTEDFNGLPFVGEAGKLLDRCMEKAGLDPNLCRWGNIVRCIPWEDSVGGRVRAPNDDEVDACSQHLDSDIMRTDPVYVVPLGSTAASYFLGSGTKITGVRGRRHIVHLPTVRFRYGRLLKWLGHNNIPVNDFIQATPTGRERALEKAKQYGFRDIPTRAFTVFPTWHPAAPLYGNKDSEYEIINDLNVLVSAITGKENEGEYHLVTDFQEVVYRLRTLLDEFKAGKFEHCAFDFESNSLDVFSPSTFITTLAFTPYKGKGWAIPWDHRESPFKRDILKQKAILVEANRAFSEIPVIGHNFKFDYELGFVRGFRFGNVLDDTELMAWTLFNDQIDHGLDYLASRYTDLKSPKQEMREAQNLLPKDERYNTDNHDIALVGKYNCMDVDSTLRLRAAFLDMLVAEDLLEPHRRFTMQAFIPTCSMEINGVKIDKSVLSTLDTSFQAEMEGCMKSLNDFGLVQLMNETLNKDNTSKKRKEFSLGSSEQLSILLFDILNLGIKKYGKVRKKGKHQGKSLPSSDKNVLQELLEDCNDEATQLAANPESNEYKYAMFKLETIKIVRDYKRVAKLFSAYVKSMPGHMQADDLVHCDFGIRHTESGRFNCKDPSLHTIPWHSPVKKMFISRYDNGLILSADFSQMELRVFAMVTGDESLVQAFVDNRDIHRLIASKVLKCSEKDVSDVDRRRIKTVVFGLLYGRGPKSIAAQEGISVDDAKRLISDVFRQFPKVRAHINAVHSFVNANGYVRYINGFRRLLPRDSKDPESMAKAERQGVNSGIQGPASDLAVVGMINMFNAINKLKLNSKHWEFKHDDLAFDVAPGELCLMMNLCKKEMVERPSHQFEYVNVPLRADFEVGISWGHLVNASMLDSSTVEFSGEEEYVVPLLERMSRWGVGAPEKLSYVVEVKEKEKVVRSGLRSADDKVQYNFIKTQVRFPPFVRLEPASTVQGLIS